MTARKNSSKPSLVKDNKISEKKLFSSEEVIRDFIVSNSRYTKSNYTEALNCIFDYYFEDGWDGVEEIDNITHCITICLMKNRPKTSSKLFPVDFTLNLEHYSTTVNKICSEEYEYLVALILEKIKKMH